MIALFRPRYSIPLSSRFSPLPFPRVPSLSHPRSWPRRKSMNRRAVVYQPPYISSLSLSLSSLCSSSFLSLPRFLPFFPPFFLSFLSFFFFFFFSIVLTVNGSDTMTSSLNGEASLRGERPFVSRQTSLTSLFLADRAPTRPKLVRSL